MVHVVVTDDGPGIPAEDQARVFDRFVRGRDATGHGGGAGLGLAIVSVIVAAHRGHVSLRSQPGHTEFELALPR
jgi:two-component system OmpR family sensor kinase